MPQPSADHIDRDPVGQPVPGCTVAEGVGGVDTFRPGGIWLSSTALPRAVFNHRQAVDRLELRVADLVRFIESEGDQLE